MTKSKVTSYIFLSIFLTLLFMLLFSSSYLDNGFRYFSYIYSKICSDFLQRFNIHNVYFGSVLTDVVEYLDILFFENIKDLIPNILMLLTFIFYLLFNLSYLKKSKAKTIVCILNTFLIILALVIIIINILNIMNLLSYGLIHIFGILKYYFNDPTNFIFSIIYLFYYSSSFIYYLNETIIKLIMFFIIILFLVSIYIFTLKLNIKKYIKALIIILSSLIGIIFILENISLLIKPVYLLTICISIKRYLISFIAYNFRLPNNIYNLLCELISPIVLLSDCIIKYFGDTLNALTSVPVFVLRKYNMSDRLLASAHILYFLFVDFIKAGICALIFVFNLIITIIWLIKTKEFKKLFSIIGFLNMFIMIIYVIIRSTLAFLTTLVTLILYYL